MVYLHWAQAYHDGDFPEQIGALVLLDVRRDILGRLPYRYVRLPPVSAPNCHPITLRASTDTHPTSTSMNWQVRPLPPRSCTFKPQNFYVGAILNVVTDVIMLAIPVPMLWGLQIKLSKKIAIALFICSGTFVIAAAIVRAALTLGSAPSGLNINRWGVRETIVGIITVNLPILRPMFRRSFWRGTTYVAESSSYGRSRPAKSGYGHGTFELRSTSNIKSGDGASDVDLVDKPRSASRLSKDSDSFERERVEANIQVRVEQTYQVKSSPRIQDEELGSWEGDDRSRSRGAFQTDITSGARK